MIFCVRHQISQKIMNNFFEGLIKAQLENKGIFYKFLALLIMIKWSKKIQVKNLFLIQIHTWGTLYKCLLLC